MRFPPVVLRSARWLAGARGAYVALVVLHASWLLTHAGGPRWRVVLGDAFFTPSFLVIAIVAWRAARAYDSAARRSAAPEARQFARAWRQLAAAYGVLWISNLAWFWADLHGGVTFEPIYAQALDLLAYSLLVAGLLRFPTMRVDFAVRRRVTLDLLTVAVGAALVTWYALLRPIAGRVPAAGLGGLGAFITALGDVAVVIAVTALLFRHGVARDRWWLRSLAAGHLASCVASLIAGAMLIEGSYLPGAPVDALWLLGDLLIFLAAEAAARQASDFDDAPATPPTSQQLRWETDDALRSAPVVGVQLWLPYVFAALAFGVLLVATYGAWRGPLGIVMAANSIVLVLVALRQAMAFRDNLALSRAHLAQERRFRSLVQYSSDLITVVDRHGTIIYQSPAVERVLGYSARSTIGTQVMPLLHPDERERFTRVMERAATGTVPVGHRLGSGRSSIWRLRHHSGRYLWVESVATALGTEPDAGMLVINTRDVTDRVRLETELRSAQKMEAVGRLAGGIAHDFNNLLTSVRVNAALLRPAVASPVVSSHELDEIDSAVDRAASLTRQLLTFSRRQVIQTQRLELGDVIRGLEPLMRRLLGPGIELHVIAEGGAWLHADPGQLEQVVMNLAVNSRDAMPQGGALSVFVTTSLVSVMQARQEPGLLPGAYVDLVVEDTGSGMSSEVLAHVFEPFFTTKSTGGGLGLSTVFGIATQLGGHVSVQSTLGKGTRFNVRLPRAEQVVERVSAALAPDDGLAAALPATSSPPREARPRRGLLSGHGERVLVVDDEESVRGALRRILVRHGYEVITARDGVEALEIEAQTTAPIDLLLTDVMMPRMDGRELMTRFLERRPGVAVICMSGYVDDALRESLPLNDCSFLAKPFGIDAVIEMVHRELEARAAV